MKNMNEIPKISILMITYNQEKVVRRALDSLIAQKDYLYEICINDDCSTDNTFRILLEYEKKYSRLIKPIRNNQNLGIFQNIEATWKRPTGEIIYRLAGDDECPNGYFSHIISYISQNNIDYKNEAICIYGDYKQVNNNGASIVYKNSQVKDGNALKLKIRQLISNRSACFSKLVLDRYVSVIVNRSYVVELTQDAELQIFSDYNYYTPIVGNIYYFGIGVSKHFTSEEREEHLKVYDHFLAFCSKYDIHIDRLDRNYIEYMKSYRRGWISKAFIYYLKSIDISLGLKGLQLKRISFVLRKRILKGI